MTMHVLAYDTAHPGDTADLARKLAGLEAGRIRRLALLVKTEGNADVNDYSREYGLMAAEQVLRRHGGDGLIARSTFLFSTGCEGAMTPFGYLLVDLDTPGGAARTHAAALAMGCAASRPLAAAELGAPAHAEITAEAVRTAMSDAGVSAADVELVIVKTPILSQASAVPGAAPPKRITSAHSKAVGALGAGLAMGEVERKDIVERNFDTNHDLYARRAMVFSGSEVDRIEVMLLANKPGAAGDLMVRTGFMADMLDAAGIRRTLREAGCRLTAEGEVEQPGQVVAAMVKAGIAPDGALRGCRTTIKTSDMDMDTHVRAAVSGITGSILGTCRVFISANTVHQAPAGGGLCSFIVRRG